MTASAVSLGKRRLCPCQICGYTWLAQANSDPRRCANKACRSMRWDATKYPDAKPPDPFGPGGVPREVTTDNSGSRYSVKFPPAAARVQKPTGGSHAAA
jgi:hypothetical protein